MSIFELTSCIELGLIYGITAIGIFLTFRIIDFPDLTCDGSFVLGAAVCAMLIKSGYNPWLTLFIATGTGALAGLITGILHTYFKVSNLLSGILTAFMLYSINLKVLGGVPNIALINLPTIFGEQNILFTLLLCALAIWLLSSWLLATDLGLALRSIGQNKKLALNCGINTQRMIIYGLMLSNALIALSGGLFAQQQGFADVSQGLGTIIIGLAAVIIGEKLLTKRSMWYAIAACILGSILYRILVAVALHSEWLGLETQDLNLITGIFIVAIMLTPSFNLLKKNA